MFRPAPWPVAVCLLGFGVTAATGAEPTSLARLLWEEGQAAMRQGRPDRAIDCYRRSLAADPHFDRNHLSLAAAYLEKGQEGEASFHLARYVAACPEQLGVRLHFAELLLRLRRLHEAQHEFERFILDAQEKPGIDHGLIVQCHSKLVQIAEALDDEYGEHLHRGVGLYLLARERAAVPQAPVELSTEGLLCKAADELKRAHDQRPEEARPCWYLYLAWSRLAQRQPALRSLWQADTAAVFTYLTPAEQHDLQLSCKQCAEEPLRQ
jgi:tetratricopeptide (TPR) repeat protein